MSIPFDHHYLPKFYLRRWTRGGKLYRFVRPRQHHPIHQKRVSPESIGFEPELYSYSDASTELERQRLELEYFQRIDDRAATAFSKIESFSRGSTIEHVGLVQFLLSLLHRSPSRIQRLRRELSSRMSDVAIYDPSRAEHQSYIRDQINDLLTDLISSPNMVSFISGMKVYHVPIKSRLKLLTCDLPLLQSDGIARPDAFLMLPYAPDKLIILAHDERVALAFSTQEHDVLVHGLNDAIIRQARQVVIANDTSAKQLIENVFDPFGAPVEGDGLLRWLVP